ncbi:MAG: hypothetical protein MUC29_13905, partial [Pyrinomonadaceae bacterium]|nr:hypothetical protein [Pyrinomonadaceae bacterium]
NRLLFSTEVASLLWEYDEKEARSLFQTAINDVRQQIVEFNFQAVSEEMEADEEPSVNTGMFFGRRGNPDFQRVLGSRQTLAMSLAEFDPNTAIDFFIETRLIITSQKYAKQLEYSDRYFETRLLNLVAQKDPSKALELGRKSIQNGVSTSHINFLKQLYVKDAEKAHTLAEEILGKIRSDKVSSTNLQNAYTLFNLATEKSSQKEKLKLNKTELLDSSQIRELSDIIAKNLLSLNQDEIEDYRYNLTDYIASVEKFSPAKAAQVRQKYGIKPKNTSNNGVSVKAMPVAVPTPKPRGTGVAVSTKSNPNQEEMMKLMSKLGKEKLTSEERDKLKGETMQKLSKTRRREEKLILLTGFITQMNMSGEKELAQEFTNEIKVLINPTPKNFLEHTTNLTLAMALAEIEPEKSFELLENSIFQMNEVINGGLKVLEFIDAQDELFADGEIQLNIGPAGGLVREIGSAIPNLSTLIPVLARADFDRTKELPNKFQRQEARFLARMIVLRSLIKVKDSNAKKADTKAVEMVDDDEMPPPPPTKPILRK